MTDWTSIFKRHFPDCISVASITQLTGGASAVTYKVILEHGAKRSMSTHCIRCEAPGFSTDNPAAQGIKLTLEAELMRLCAKVDVPVPIVEAELSKEVDGVNGIVLSWVEGETLGNKIVKMKINDEVDLAYNCGKILAKIHNIDLTNSKAMKLLEKVSPLEQVQKYLDSYKAYQEFCGSIPALDYCFQWLISNCPSENGSSLVHGDFRNGNLIIKPDGVKAVIDWELSHIGDPMLDLGWMLGNSWRFGNSHLPVGGFGHLESFYRGYESEGLSVDKEKVKFWLIWGQTAWSVMTLRFAYVWKKAEGSSQRNMEQAAIGRRASEGIVDSLFLILSHDVISQPLRTPKVKAIKPYNVETNFPSGHELLTAVQQMLKQDIIPQVELRSKYLCKVASNMLSMVQRELLYGEGFEKEEISRIQELLDDNRGKRFITNASTKMKLVTTLREALAHSIKSRAISLDNSDLQKHLWQTSVDQLFIDNPKYSTYMQIVEMTKSKL